MTSDDSTRTRVSNVRVVGRKVAGTVYVGRAGHGEDGKWGNPYRPVAGESPASTLPRYASYLHLWWSRQDFSARAVNDLGGQRLLCFCLDNEWDTSMPTTLRCHAQVLAVYVDVARGLYCPAEKQIVEWLR